MLGINSIRGINFNFIGILDHSYRDISILRLYLQIFFSPNFKANATNAVAQLPDIPKAITTASIRSLSPILGFSLYILHIIVKTAFHIF